METPLDELQWKSPEWIQAFGLRTDNVLDYFSESPFFDKTSNNHVIKMQKQFSQLPNNDTNSGNNTGDNPNEENVIIPGSLNSNIENDISQLTYLDPIRRDILLKYPIYLNFEKELIKMNGIEYVLICVREPDFWVIRKQKRYQQIKFEFLQDYYIIGANVYQSPSVYKIVQNRLMSTSLNLMNLIQNVQNLTNFKPSQGIQFKRPVESNSPVSNTGNNNNNNTTTTTGTTSNNNILSVPASTISRTTSNLAGTHTFSSANTINTSQFNNNGSSSREILNEEMMDRLMLTSMKSEPEYIQ